MWDLGAGSAHLCSDSTWTQAPSHPQTDAKRLSIPAQPRLVSPLRHVSPCLLSTLQSQLNASFDFMRTHTRARIHTHTHV